MKFFYAEDNEWYRTAGFKLLKDKYGIKEIVIVLNEEDLIQEVKKIFNKLHSSTAETKDAALVIEDYGFLSPFFSHSFFKIYGSFFEIYFLKNKYGLLTSQEKNSGMNAIRKLKEKLDTSITKPTLTLKDYGGATLLTEQITKINTKFKLGMPVKGMFLNGIPGTGKSFFAKCVAGELDRYLIELNMTKIIEAPNSVLLIEDFFEFFKENEGDYIIWIDEIEKMFVGTPTATQVLGTLLTKINDFSSGNNKSSAFIIATANNVGNLSKNHPELFRNGRFDWLVNINPPSDEGAEDIFNIYINKSRKENEIHILKALYFSVLGELKHYEENSFISKIVDYANKQKGAITQFIKSNNIDNCNKFINQLKADEQMNYFEISMKEDLEKYKFEMNLSLIKANVFDEYRRKSSDMINFPYVPAEIEYLVSSLYEHYLFVEMKITDKIAQEYIKKVKPLQVTMKEQISDMKSVTTDFLQI